MYTLDYLIAQNNVYFSKTDNPKSQYDAISMMPNDCSLLSNHFLYAYFASKQSPYIKNDYSPFNSNNYEHPFSPQIFLTENAQKISVQNHDEIISHAKEAFRLMLGKDMPENILIHIHPMPVFKEIHSVFWKWSNGIQGFSINGKDKKLIFVRENDLCSMLITTGHEIGHVYTDALPNAHDEEAKAFAFTIEWAKTLKKFDIGGVGGSIKDELKLNPAKNGLHDIALDFVLALEQVRNPWGIHNDLTKGYISLFDFPSIYPR